MKNLHIDFETACTLDLTAVGLHRYIEDGSFMPLCVAWKLDTNDVRVERLDDGGGLPEALCALLQRADVQAHAWNAAFEDEILRKYYGVHLAQPLSCTMQRGLAYGLPAKLERAGPALGCRWTKDMAGHKVMKRMSREPGAVWPEADWNALLKYCMQDVLAEAEIAGLIPELSAAERALSEVDRAMNNRGVWIDTSAVKLLADVADDAQRHEAARATCISGGTVTSPGTQTDRLTAWLTGKGLAIPDVKRDTVKEALAKASTASTASALVDADAVEMLGIRLRTARASTKKLAGVLERVSSGDRLRGQFQFLGAARTGRWAGRGVQLQNLPRVPPGFDPLSFISTARVSEVTQALGSLDAMAPFPVLDCVSWSLRACLGPGPGPGGALWGFDFSQIEARVLAWLAGQQDVLQVFRSGNDVYVWAAKQFGSDNRQLGKVLILALGYGMGAVKLRDTAWKNYRVTMTAAEAAKFHREWRQRNPRIVAFWDTIGAAARDAILNPGTAYPVLPSAIALRASRKTLKMILPSGRILYYHRPRVEAHQGITYWGEEKSQWVQRRTWGGTLAENATQAVARDIMAEAMMRAVTRASAVPLMTVHDELVYWEGGDGEALERLMKEAPMWAGGLPIDGEVKVMSRYGVVTKA